MEAQALFDLAMQHKWIALSALLIGFVIRLLKSDTKLPVDIPPRYRVWVALGLGIAAGVLDNVANGTPWKTAIIGGLSAAMVAITGHGAIVGSLRGGKEFVVPGMMKPGVPPGPGKPPSMPPPPPPPAVKADDSDTDVQPTPRDGQPPSPMPPVSKRMFAFASVLALVFGLGASCSPAEKRGARTAIDLATATCVILRGDIGNGTVDQICALEEELGPIVKHLFAARKFKETHPGLSGTTPKLDACTIPLPEGTK